MLTQIALTLRLTNTRGPIFEQRQPFILLFLQLKDRPSISHPHVALVQLVACNYEMNLSCSVIHCDLERTRTYAHTLVVHKLILDCYESNHYIICVLPF